ncbi:hypothetical protein PhCBS80983_g05040 [Powellomyces hirtus]|uniref:Phytase-like domain-containing protein n=1 Tax=Powellomyces hirtus TaxID=109895 RepID=A0A507DXS6_9FUNG|nr:hypothetical protein DFJ77DRAFT_457512 [Powellomyces hirtus]TPX55768.1 hypothetical protein PhCBS80983_g05040 [Powellomyces hirtus]
MHLPTSTTLAATLLAALTFAHSTQSLPTTHVRAPQCVGESFMSLLPGDFEPSDLAFDATSNNLYVVSDDGRLATFDHVVDDRMTPATVVQLGSPKDYDFEGATVVPHRPDFVYLSNEFPAAIVEYSKKEQKVTRTWTVQTYLDADLSAKKSNHKNAGIESLLYEPTSGTFYAGRQSDARVFVFAIDLDGTSATLSSTTATLVGKMDPPGPGKDLAAITLWRNNLWFLYDKSLALYPVTVQDAQIPADYKPTDVLDATQLTNTDIGALKFDTRGQEGIVFVEVPDTGAKYVFVAVDPPRGKGYEKDLRRYTVDAFFECFSKNGAPADPIFFVQA